MQFLLKIIFPIFFLLALTSCGWNDTKISNNQSSTTQRDSFSYEKEWYNIDSNALYYKGNRVQWSTLSGFIDLWEGYAKDENFFYACGVRIPRDIGIDFESLKFPKEMDGYGYDKYRYYYRDSKYNWNDTKDCPYPNLIALKVKSNEVTDGKYVVFSRDWQERYTNPLWNNRGLFGEKEEAFDWRLESLKNPVILGANRVWGSIILTEGQDAWVSLYRNELHPLSSSQNDSLQYLWNGYAKIPWGIVWHGMRFLWIDPWFIVMTDWVAKDSDGNMIQNGSLIKKWGLIKDLKLDYKKKEDFEKIIKEINARVSIDDVWRLIDEIWVDNISNLINAISANVIQTTSQWTVLSNEIFKVFLLWYKWILLSNINSWKYSTDFLEDMLSIDKAYRSSMNPNWNNEVFKFRRGPKTLKENGEEYSTNLTKAIITRDNWTFFITKESQ